MSGAWADLRRNALKRAEECPTCHSEPPDGIPADVWAKTTPGAFLELHRHGHQVWKELLKGRQGHKT